MRGVVQPLTAGMWLFVPAKMRVSMQLVGERSRQRGAGEILLTSWDQWTAQGTIWTSSTQCRAVRYPSLRRVERLHPPFVDAISGADGVSRVDFHDGDYVVEDVKKVMRAAGVEVRL